MKSFELKDIGGRMNEIQQRSTLFYEQLSDESLLIQSDGQAKAVTISGSTGEHNGFLYQSEGNLFLLFDFNRRLFDEMAVYKSKENYSERNVSIAHLFTDERLRRNIEDYVLATDVTWTTYKVNISQVLSYQRFHFDLSVDTFFSKVYGGDIFTEIRLFSGSYVTEGSQSSDKIVGQYQKNIIFGRQGNDTLTGWRYKDVIHGGKGNDIVWGGAENDTLYGLTEHDTLKGGLGQDLLYGGLGNDKLQGDSGHDRLYGEENKDLLSGGVGNDTLWGGQDSDRLIGGDGNDYLSGGTENDKLYGRNGNDSLKGDSGNDTLVAGRGQDTVFGGLGNDIIYGASGNDFIEGQEGRDTIFAGSGADSLNGGEQEDRLYGQDGNDNILGQDGDDIIFGNRGADTLEGGHGADRLYGGHDNDYLFGASGNDLIVGGQGNDTLLGGEGRNSLRGNDGDDLLLSYGWSAVIDDFQNAAFLTDTVSEKPLHSEAARHPNLIFQSGFESGSTAIQRQGRAIDIRGIDQSVDSANDWDQDLPGFWINYVDYDKGGQNPNMLGANIVSDPDNKNNKVFYTWQKDAEKQDNGPYSRVQGELNNLDWPEIYYKVRFRLSRDIASVDAYSKSDASLSMVEFVTGQGNKRKLVRLVLHKWGDNRSFANGKAPLQWRAEVLNWNDKRGHELFKPSGVTPEYDQWQTLEFYMKSGDDQTGRFWVRLNESQVLFDETVETKTEGASFDIERISFLKSYGGELVKEVKKHGGQVDVWFDDLEIWNALPPELEKDKSGPQNQTRTLSKEAVLLERYQRFSQQMLKVENGADVFKEQSIFSGGEGSDILISGDGHDLLDGGSGDDILKAGQGNDTLTAGMGDDILIGDDGHDRLIAHEGTNILVGGLGQDTLIGGQGTDIFVMEAHPEYDQIENFESGVDKIDIRSLELHPAILDADSNGWINKHDAGVRVVDGDLNLSFGRSDSGVTILNTSRLSLSDLIG